MNVRLVSLTGVLLSLPLNPLAFGQDSVDATVTDQKRTVSEDRDTMVVTGTRASGRSAEKSASPVDVFDGDDLLNQGDGDLTSLMQTLVPSYNVTTQPISDAGTVVRPANLRGLPPDSTLVLVNGKRRHRSAVISFLGQGVSDGAQGVDLSMIPAIAVERAELLRDGASALYGSDAIAGVLNFVLREDDQGVRFEAKAGSYYEGDGSLFQYAGNAGLPLFNRGFANVSFEYRQAEATSRSVQRDDAAALIAAGNASVADPAQTWGQPEIKDDLKVFLNLGQPINDNLELYAFGNYGTRNTEGGFYYRNPETRAGVFSNDGGVTALVADVNPDNDLNCPAVPLGDTAALQQITQNDTELGRECFFFAELFPGGFTPSFGGKMIDSAATAGLRGELVNGFRYDLSAGIGRNQIDFYINNTVNATLGPNTPTSFEPGGYEQEDQQVNLDLSYPIPVGAFASDLNVAVGLERRREQFTINAGEPASYTIGPFTEQGFSIGSNGFPGFSPEIAGSFSRFNNAAYLDLEADVTSQVLVGVAARWEDYEDWGVTRNGRIATRWSPTSFIALRGTYSTGFRAPTPGQANVTNTTTAFENGRLVNRGTIPPTNPIAQLKGGEQLQPETSVQYTIGTILKAAKLTTTIDYFNIKIDDRIAQSASQSLTDAEAAALEAQGIAGASDLSSFRFYTNGFSTRTEGIDIVASYPFRMLGGASYLRLAGNWTDTKVASFQPGVLNETRIKQLEEGLPKYRANLSLSQQLGNWRGLARLNYFGSFYEAHLDDGSLPIEAGDEYTVDAEIAYSVSQNFTLVVGGQNIFNEYPDEHDYQGIAGAKYPETSPMGFNGGFYYSRLVYIL